MTLGTQTGGGGTVYGNPIPFLVRDLVRGDVSYDPAVVYERPTHFGGTNASLLQVSNTPSATGDWSTTASPLPTLTDAQTDTAPATSTATPDMLKADAPPPPASQEEPPPSEPTTAAADTQPASPAPSSSAAALTIVVYVLQPDPAQEPPAENDRATGEPEQKTADAQQQLANPDGAVQATRKAVYGPPRDAAEAAAMGGAGAASNPSTPDATGSASGTEAAGDQQAKIGIVLIVGANPAPRPLYVTKKDVTGTGPGPVGAFFWGAYTGMQKVGQAMTYPARLLPLPIDWKSRDEAIEWNMRSLGLKGTNTEVATGVAASVAGEATQAIAIVVTLQAALPVAGAAAGSALSKVPGGAAVVTALTEATPGAVQFVQGPWVQLPLAGGLGYVAYQEGKASYYYAKAGDTQAAIDHGSNVVIVLAFAGDSAAQGAKGLAAALATDGASRYVAGITAEQAALLRQKLLSIPGAEDVRAFGSRTKGTSTANSDLDIIIIGDVNTLSPNTIPAVRGAQQYALRIGIGTGDGLRPLDIHIYSSYAEFRAAWIASPNFDPALGVPNLLPLK
ncbi:MAG TPA: nucleotidyltransferase domain-containing protein [Pirellulales bacterium]|nr:nucleotidyltransferase domain-containing protein [Pirellulales bacterium]